MVESGYGSLLKAENIRLKEQIRDLQDTLVNLTKSVHIFSSGIAGNQQTSLNDQINEIIHNSTTELNIVSPKIGMEYKTMLINKAKAGTKIQIVINDRRYLINEEEKKGVKSKKSNKDELTKGKKEIKYNYAEIYDNLKSTPGIDLINNPNVKFLMVVGNDASNSPERAVFSSGWLERRVLDKTILLGTYLEQDRAKLKELMQIYNQLLPSFMRK